MRILFLRPRPAEATIGLQHLMVVEPLELETLAASLEARDTPAIVDMTLERDPLEHFLRREAPDVVCVTGYITHVPIVIGYCRTVKRLRPTARTIVGGVHCEVCPQDFSDDSVDFRVLRNATTVLPRLLDHIRGEGAQPPGVLAAGARLEHLTLPPFDFHCPLPNRDLTDHYRRRYFYIFHDRVALLKTSFGCPYSCSFCFCRLITEGSYFERPIDSVMTEMETIRERNVYIVDDDFLVGRSRLLELAEEMARRRLDKRYIVYGRADFIARHPDVLERLKDVGLRTVIVGFESFFAEELSAYGKGTDPSTNREAMRVLTRLGIDCYATIIVPPHWSRLEFLECGRIMRSLGIHYVNLQPLTPLPGTGCRTADSSLVLSRSDFARWDLAHVTIAPERMSLEEFYRSIIRLYNQVLFRPSYLWSYVRQYRIDQLLRMALGTYAVARQYRRNLFEAASRSRGHVSA